MLKSLSAARNPWRYPAGRFLTLAIVGAFALSACSGPGAAPSEATPKEFRCDAPAASDADASLTFFTAAGERLASTLQSLSDAFMKEYPKITVKLQTEADNNYNTVTFPACSRPIIPLTSPSPNDLIGALKRRTGHQPGCLRFQIRVGERIPSSGFATGCSPKGVSVRAPSTGAVERRAPRRHVLQPGTGRTDRNREDPHHRCEFETALKSQRMPASRRSSLPTLTASSSLVQSAPGTSWDRRTCSMSSGARPDATRTAPMQEATAIPGEVSGHRLLRRRCQRQSTRTLRTASRRGPGPVPRLRNLGHPVLPESSTGGTASFPSPRATPAARRSA